MNKLKSIAIFIITLSVNNCFAQNPDSKNDLKLVATIQMPDVRGRIDHLAFDNKNKTIFIAALGNNTVEVIDAKTFKLNGRRKTSRTS